MMRTIKYIFVHCTASQQTATVQQILREFTQRGWKTPGYHYIVDAKGILTQLVAEDRVSNGVKGYNAESINVAYIGGIDAKNKAVDNRTPEQKKTLLDILTRLKQKYTEAIIMGHRDISPDKNHNGIVDPWERIKECPCFNAKTEYANIK
jgi:Negative regulator of beta-lactamase expression